MKELTNKTIIKRFEKAIKSRELRWAYIDGVGFCKVYVTGVYVSPITAELLITSVKG